MQAELRQLGREHWPELYRLMVARGFPHVPGKFSEAAPYFESARVMGVLEGSELAVGFVVGPAEDGVAFFDVVCSRKCQGKWANREVLACLYDMAFRGMGLRCLWVQPRHPVALKAALQAGFTPATSLEGDEPVLVMTPFSCPRWLKQRKEEN